jgi:DNA-directed RNA polymerase subunit alpha
MHIRWRQLELPSVVECDKSTLSTTYGKFTAEPFERGFGVTIGNSLRRILLSSLMGSAVTQIKIQGAQHEFTSLEGVQEDVTEVVLNVKALCIKNHSDSLKVIHIEKNEAGVIRGSDIITDGDVDVINGDHVIATLNEDTPFMMEMVVENGRGYVPASEQEAGENEIGIIPIDAVYSPITRVRYHVDQTRVGQKTNYDKLTIEIWTDGSLHPEMAIVEAAKILRKHLNPFVQYSELGAQVHAADRSARSPADIELDAKLNMPLASLQLSVRANNCLETEHIHTVRELVQQTEDGLLEVRNFGETTLVEVREQLSELGLHLGMRVPPPAQTSF